MGARAGFTLLEMLISVAILALLITTAVQAFQGISRAEERARSGLGRGRTAETVLDRLETELLGAVLVPRTSGDDPLLQPFLFLGETRAEGELRADAIRFITRSPARGPGAPPSGLRMVSYALVPSTVETPMGDMPVLDLLRREEAVPEGLRKEISIDEGDVIATAVAGFQLRYLGGEDEEWKNRWDSVALGQTDQLPNRVEVGLQLYREDDTGVLIPDDALLRSVELRVRPETFSAGAPGDDPCGLTVSACWSQHLEPALDDSAHSFIAPLYERVDPGMCWNDPSEELDTLKTQLNALGVSAGSNCT